MDDLDENKARKAVMLATEALTQKGEPFTEADIEALAVTFMDEKIEKIEADLSFREQGPVESRRKVLQRHATTHGGRMAIADAIEKGKLSIEEFKDALRRTRDSATILAMVESMLRNPCALCDSVRLQSDWAGSGYCSHDCCKKAMRSGNDHQREYARQIYDNWVDDVESGTR